ncbi:MAG: L,D-transpeptidase family protein [Alphaproteobacteria bacterium]|nr:L,D-transpeptidase family protein [Alphaproteobacteria bacterium]MBV8406373.1 L,D-transpeptidase family protein [Alphaproteobacteria bacterium]
MAKDRATRGVAGLLATAMATAACVPTDPPPQAAAPVASSMASLVEAPPKASAYLGLLRRSGIEMAIPPSGKFILVNIPSYELVALQDGEPVLRSRVVVGKPATPTPELTAAMVAVRFNPDWTPTPAMIRNEGLHYMPPGPDNPLGRLMFDLDDDELIYLHDTNEKYLFNRKQRAISHGCIRVQQARALAAWVLGVSPEAVDSLIARGSNSVPVSEDIPVALVYSTRFPDENGEIVSYPDVYAGRQTADAR